MREYAWGAIVRPLTEWYGKAGRDLEWRRTRDPYRIWVSEIMLQQTRVEAVRAYYRVFLETFPTVKDLADSDPERLALVWQGLGYYSRARNMRAAAREVADRGAFPTTAEGLKKLKGIGDYTAAAVASIAFGEPVAAVDGNVLRVVSRLSETEENVDDPRVRREVGRLLSEVIPAEDPGAFNQAMMDLGATVCLPNGAPLCEKCPLKNLCESRANGTQRAFPVRAEKRKRKEQTLYVLLWEREGKVAVRKRPPKGLLASLWEFPNYTELPPRYSDAEVAGRGSHVFTHIVWNMVFLRAKGKPEPDWTMAEKSELGTVYPLPSAFSKFLSFLSDPPSEICGRE